MPLSEERISLMVRLGQYFKNNNADWENVLEQAERMNGWFTQEYLHLAIKNITEQFLDEGKLRQWLAKYPELTLKDEYNTTVGLVMAGNIPLVGFHDFLCVYLAGFNLKLKLSSKDTVLWEHIIKLLGSWDARFAEKVMVADMLKDCDAYIATGSNNSARYFEQYFKKYPHIIRKNRTSVAVLNGHETPAELEALADDVCTYFGLGCRNITKIFVPEDYAFEPLLSSFNKYKHHYDHNKYRNNYDFQLAIFLLNKVEYMTNGSVTVVPGESPFAAISVLHYETYKDENALLNSLAGNDDLQCITARKASATDAHNIVSFKAFGQNQQPGLGDYADGIDTMKFLSGLIS